MADINDRFAIQSLSNYNWSSHTSCEGLACQTNVISWCDKCVCVFIKDDEHIESMKRNTPPIIRHLLIECIWRQIFTILLAIIICYIARVVTNVYTIFYLCSKITYDEHLLQITKLCVSGILSLLWSACNEDILNYYVYTVLFSSKYEECSKFVFPVRYVCIIIIMCSSKSCMHKSYNILNVYIMIVVSTAWSWFVRTYVIIA